MSKGKIRIFQEESKNAARKALLQERVEKLLKKKEQ